TKANINIIKAERLSMNNSLNNTDSLVNILNNINEYSRINRNIINSVGDCPNIKAHIFKYDPFWKDVITRNNWTCQQNIISGNARIVDPEGYRLGNGSLTAMIEKMHRLQSRSFFIPGDVIGVLRSGMYEHYAIYVGNDRVIHYSGQNGELKGKITIHEGPISEFTKNSKSVFVVWFDNGHPIKLRTSTSFLFNTCMDYYGGKFQGKKRNVYSNKETIRRAKSRLGESNYSIVSNNCEHFAMWCKTGVSESSQVNLIKNASL
ncbi:MAG: lecithin retinol acyltransferase family protein, partial [Butyrivibrio sp.]|nr:lecithin retinol acyltransferase family protein [Butyrivibrio sp.]